MKNFLLGLFTFVISSPLVFGQDTTALRLIGISPTSELVFLNNDSTVLSSVSTGMNSGHAIFENPNGDTLYALMDGGAGDRSIYVVSPLSGTNSAAFSSSGTYYASADITPDGRVFAITGNAASTQGAIFEIDLINQTETQVAVSNVGGGNSRALEVIPDSNKIFVMEGFSGDIHTMEIDTWTQGLLSTNLGGEELHGMYNDGNTLLATTFFGGFYTIDLSVGTNAVLINNQDLMDVAEFDLISTHDTISFCPGDSAMISSRYTSNTYQWYVDGAAIPGATNMDVYATQSGTYQLVAEIGTTGNYIWSEAIEAEHYTVPNVSLSASDSSFCAGDSVLLTGSFGGTSQWYLNGIAIPGATSNTYYASQGGLYNMTKTNMSGCTDSSASGLTITELNCFQVTASATPVLCNGLCDGAATAVTTAGNPPYTFSWDDPGNQTNASATGLCAGTYVITAIDSSGLTATDTVTVSEPAALTATANANLQVLCNTNSSATATASVLGGTAPYAFLWNDALAQTDSTATNLASGSYDVVITDDNACTITTSVTVGFVASITSSYAPICGGICDGSITVTETGGSAPVSYSWNDPSSQNTATASNLCGNATYIVVATDNDGCVSSDSIVMTVPSPLNITVNTTDVDCYGGNDGIATAATTGGSNPYTYLWLATGGTSATETFLTSGSYDVIVTDNNGCSKTEIAVINQPSDSLSTSIAITHASCYNGNDGVANLAVSGGTTPYSYKWQNASTSSQDTSGLTAGTYYVEVEDDNGCKAHDTAIVTQPVQLILSGSSTADTGGNNGTCWVVASGGTPSYDYLWNDIAMQTNSTATGLASTTYTVTVTDDNDCESVLSISVADTNSSVFQNSYQGDWDDLCRAADNVAGGGYVLAGYTESYGAGGSDASIVVTDEHGNFQWSNTYGGTGDDGANAVIQTNDGGFLLCGYTESYGAGGVDVYVIKTDGNGVVSWSNAYGGSGDDRGYSVLETTSGEFIIAGGTESFGQGTTDAYLLSLDASGTLQWSKTYGGNGNDYGYDVLEVSTGGYIIAGNTYSYGAGLSDVYLIKVGSTGTLDWTKVFGGAGDDVAWSVLEGSDGGFVIGGHSNSFGNGNEDVLVLKTDALGSHEWTKTYGGSGDDIAYDMEATIDGYAIAGYSNSFGSGSDYMYLLAMDENGENHWSQTYGSTFNDRGWDLVLSPNNAYVIAGNTKSYGNNIAEGLWEKYLVKTDGNGDVNCNQIEASTLSSDTTSTLSFGGVEGSGGAETAAITMSNAVSMVGDTLCFTTVGSKEAPIFKQADLLIYPNPNNGAFNILLSNVPGKTYSVRIFNLHGQLMSELTTGSITHAGSNHWVADGLKPGVYFVQVQTASGMTTQKVICQ